MKHRYFSVFSCLVSFLIIVFLLYFFDVSKALVVLGSADVFFVVFAFLLAGFVLFLKAYRWHILLLDSGYKAEISRSCVSMFMGLFVGTFTPGKVGEPVRAYFLKKMTGDRMSGTVPLVIVERLADVVLLVLVSIYSVFVFMSEADAGKLHFFEIFVFATFVVLCSVFVLMNKKVVFFLVGKLTYFFRLKVDLDIFYLTLSRVKKRMFMWRLMVATVVVWFFEGLVLYVSLLAVGLFLSPLFCFVVVSVSFLVGAITFLPGGLGSLEAALIFLLSLSALDVNAVVAGVIIYRVLSYAVFGVLGVGSMFFLDRWTVAGESG